MLQTSDRSIWPKCHHPLPPEIFGIAPAGQHSGGSRHSDWDANLISFPVSHVYFFVGGVANVYR